MLWLLLGFAAQQVLLVVALRPGVPPSRRILAAVLILVLPLAGPLLALLVRRVRGAATAAGGEPAEAEEARPPRLADIRGLGEQPPLLERVMSEDAEERLAALATLSSSADATAVELLRWVVEHGAREAVLDAALTIEELELRCDQRLADARRGFAREPTADRALAVAEAATAAVVTGIADAAGARALGDEARACYQAALAMAPARRGEIEEVLARHELGAGHPAAALEILTRLTAAGSDGRAGLAAMRDQAAFAARRFDLLAVGLLLGLAACTTDDPGAVAAAGPAACQHEVARPAPGLRVVERAGGPRLSVSALDRSAPGMAAADGAPPLPVEARLLVVTGDGSESGLEAIRSALDHQGTPYNLFVATDEPPLTAARLSSGDRGFYQGIILTNDALAVAGASAFSAEEWQALADYEAHFQVRRASLDTWPDEALGFGEAGGVETETTPLVVTCTDAGRAVFHDVNCGQGQEIRGAFTYLARAVDTTQLTPLLTDAAGDAVAAVHRGADGRESLLLMFASNAYLYHSLVFLHGVIGWVSGGTYLGDRRVYLSAQLDDLFLASALHGGGTYRIDERDLQAGLDWEMRWRNSGSAPGFRVAFAFNGLGVSDGDPLTRAVQGQRTEWHWISHTFTHQILDAVDYDTAFEELDRNREQAEALELTGHDVRNLVTPGVSGLANAEAMRAAVAAGIRFAVSDTSRAGCDNPSPNTAFYNALAPEVLLVPRRATALFFNVSTPDEWVAEYNELYREEWQRDSDYPQVLDQESDQLLRFLLRGEADPWMFHQANLRAYDGVHSLVSDLIDATLDKLTARLSVPVLTPSMEAIAARFADRMQSESAGVRATLWRGRALVIDAARPTPVVVSGVRAADGEAYGGEAIGVVAVAPGATACLPLDAAGLGCSPAPAREGGPGPTREIATAICNSSSGGGDPGSPGAAGGGTGDGTPTCAAGGAAGADAVLVLLVAGLLGRRRRYSSAA